MLDHVYYLLTMDNPSGERGKIILFSKNGQYETHWSVLDEDQEETLLSYSGSDLQEAWEAAEALQFEKAKEGFALHHPLINFSLSAIPPRFLYVRMLEYFASLHVNQLLLQDLKKWRKSTASAAGIPPYFIGTDKLLSIIATFIPHEEEQLLQIPGIGQNKLLQYGSAILEKTKAYEQIYSFPLHWVEQQVSLDQLVSWMVTEKKQRDEKKESRVKKEKEEKLRLLECMKDQMSLEEVADRLSVPIAQVLDRVSDLAEEGYDVVSYLQMQVERIQEKDDIADVANALGSQRLKPIYEKLYGTGEGTSSKEIGERYNRIRVVCAYMKLKVAS